MLHIKMQFIFSKYIPKGVGFEFIDEDVVYLSTLQTFLRWRQDAD